MERTKTWTEKQNEEDAQRKAASIAKHDLQRHMQRWPYHPAPSDLEREARFACQRSNKARELAQWHRDMAALHARDAAFDHLRWAIIDLVIEAEHPQGEIDLLELSNNLGMIRRAAEEAGTHPHTRGIAQEEADQAQE